MDNRQQKIQYHPPFCAALELELRANKRQISCEAEHNLNSKPNTIDLLVVKMEEQTRIQSGLGAIFRKYNLFEYKSPQDVLNRKIYYRTIGYANLYIAYEAGAYSMDEVSISFVRDGMPQKLMEQFREEDFTIREYEPGIYHVTKTGHVDMQIIVLRQLGAEYKWITKLNDRVEREDMQSLMDEICHLEDMEDRLNAESVLDVVTRLNQNKEWMKEDSGMGEFRELFREEFEKRDHKIAEQNEQLAEKNEQLAEQNEQLAEQHEKITELSEQVLNQNEQLQTKDEENSRLREEIAELKKQLNRIAML